jgi:hypothetical protein
MAQAANPTLSPETKIRRFTEFYDGAESWSRVRRIIVRVEAGDQGVDVRFIVTNIATGRGKSLYERCARGRMENHIKSYKRHLAADRTSCGKATANQVRLFLHAAAYWLLWALQATLPKRSPWRTVQFDTIRLRLIKIAARVDELKKRVRVRLPGSADPAPLRRAPDTAPIAHLSRRAACPFSTLSCQPQAFETTPPGSRRRRRQVAPKS